MRREILLFLAINLVLPGALSAALRALPIAPTLAPLLAAATLIAAANLWRLIRAERLRWLYAILLPANLAALWLVGTLSAIRAIPILLRIALA